jgi:hypothetical protein
MFTLSPLPLLVSAAAYWILGALWYSALFGGIWSRGLESQGITVPKPSSGEIARKFVGTFVANLVTVIAVGWVINATGTSNLAGAVNVGLLLGGAVTAMGLAVSYTWEGKPRANFLIDASYHTAGTVACAVILTVWR